MRCYRVQYFLFWIPNYLIFCSIAQQKASGVDFSGKYPLKIESSRIQFAFKICIVEIVKNVILAALLLSCP